MSRTNNAFDFVNLNDTVNLAQTRNNDPRNGVSSGVPSSNNSNDNAAYEYWNIPSAANLTRDVFSDDNYDGSSTSSTTTSNDVAGNMMGNNNYNAQNNNNFGGGIGFKPATMAPITAMNFLSAQHQQSVYGGMDPPMQQLQQQVLQDVGDSNDYDRFFQQN